MLQLSAGKDAGEREGSVRFKRHRREQTLLYRLVEQYHPDFEMQWAAEGRVLPDYVRREFDEYLKCGRLEHGFLRVQCKLCHAEHLVAFSCTNSRRFRRTQRFLSQLRCTPRPTASLWDLSKAAKSSPCKRCLMNAMRMEPWRPETWLDYSGHPALRPSGPPVQLIQRNFPALPHVAAHNGCGRVSAGLRTDVGRKTAKRGRGFRALCRYLGKIPGRSA